MKKLIMVGLITIAMMGCSTTPSIGDKMDIDDGVMIWTPRGAWERADYDSRVRSFGIYAKMGVLGKEVSELSDEQRAYFKEPK